MERLGVQRLDLVCLTHPHEDHFAGLAQVMQYFTSEGRTVGTFCDSGVEPKQIATLMRRRHSPSSVVTEFERLYRFVYNLMDAGRIRYFMANENSSPLIEVGDRIRLVPVGPRPDVLSRAIRDVVSAGRMRKDLNRISVVLALSVQGENSTFDALLAADTDSEGCNSALKRFAEVTRGDGRLDVVKVSHHGSADSHFRSRICGHRKSLGATPAVISAASFDVLPDREVLADFLRCGWTVLLTAKRVAPTKHFALELSGRGRGGFGVQTHDIQVTWREADGTKWSPDEARVDAMELPNYGSARGVVISAAPPS